jgi:hypothetical protein
MGYPIMKKIKYVIIALVLITLSLNMLLLADTKLIGYFKWVNAFTGFTLLAILLLTWLAKKCLDRQKSNYVHKIFSKN